MIAIELKFDGWVTGTKWALTTPHFEGSDQEERGKWRLHRPSPIPCYNAKQLGTLSINLVGKVTDLEMFFT